jgi:hypothetical protein
MRGKIRVDARIRKRKNKTGTYPPARTDEEKQAAYQDLGLMARTVEERQPAQKSA